MNEDKNQNLLMILGPTEIEDDVLLMGAKPQVYLRTHEFAARLKQIFNDLKYVFQTRNPVVIYASSGTGAMEAAVTNVLSSNDTVLVINGGDFGHRWTEICQKHNIIVQEVVVEFGKSVIPQLIENALKENSNIKAVFATYTESSSGALTDIKCLGKIVKNYPDCILVVDCISALIVEPMQMDDWCIDIAISSSQKAFAIPAGLGFMSISEKALKFARNSNLRTFYFDIFEYIKELERGQTPYTVPISLLYQLELRLKKIVNEGLGPVQARYRTLTNQVRKGLDELGFHVFAEHPANCVTAVLTNQYNAHEIVNIMREKHGISICPSPGELKEKMFRVGNFGNVDELKIERFLNALKLTLEELKRTAQGRVYNEIIEIDSDAIKSFWNARANYDKSMKSVLLGTDLVKNSANNRNKKELNILKSFVPMDKKINILDVGCGIGRWAFNLKPIINIYHGIDISDKLLQTASASFAGDSNIMFFNMSGTHLDYSRLLNRYDLIIITGVLMYINDSDLIDLFGHVDKLVDQKSVIYIQESVSILDGRLTLKNFHSVELNSQYSAIYRTPNEYKDFINKYLPNFSIRQTNLLLDKETGAREETNAQYWCLNWRDK